MSKTRGWGSRLRALVMRDREEREMEEEIRFHLEMEERKLTGEGMSPGQARTEARRRFGGEDRMKERTRDERGARWLEDTVRDVRYAARALARAPGFALVSVLALSLGVGATTAIYTLVDGVLLSPLPYPDSRSLVAVWERNEDGGSLHASYLNFADWRGRSRSFEALAAFTPTRATTVLTGRGGVRARVTSASADLFAVGGVAPERGRLPLSDEHLPGAPPLAVVSHSFWQEALGAPEHLAGTTVDVQGTVYDVVGVMPPGFVLPDEPDLWISLDRAVPWSVRGNHVVAVLGRLAPDATAESAARELDGVHRTIREAAPEVESVGVTVRPYLDQVVGDSGRALGLLLGAATILLLVACTNVASALLARGTGRVRELGVRASLGASRERLVRQLFMESLTLAGLGAAGGVVTAQAILSLTRWVDPGAVPRLAEVTLHGGVLALTLVVTVGTALLFGLWPALSLTRGDVASAVRTGRDGYSRGTRLAWRMVLAGEVAMAVILLVSGGLVIRSLGAILDRDGGFRTDGVVTGRVEMPLGKYETADEALAVLRQLLDELRSGPTVADAGLTLLLPVPGRGSMRSQVELEDGTRTDQVLEYRVADAGLFRSLDIPVVRGRLFEESDGPGSPHVAVVDQAMADALWPGEDPLGRTFNPRGMDPWPGEVLTVIGVVGNADPWDRSAGTSPGYYVHYTQRPAFLGLFGASLVVRTDDVNGGMTLLRETVRRVDRDVPVVVSTLRRDVARSAGSRRFNAFVLTGFALAALLLAAVGVYGVVAYTVARRTREMGIRVALGARPSEVRGTVQREVLLTVLAGAATGVAGAALVTRLLEEQLFGVAAYDPATFAACLATLAAAAWAASWIPAWRGTRLDPADVLRQE
jgi:predicted permease